MTIQHYAADFVLDDEVIVFALVSTSGEHELVFTTRALILVTKLREHAAHVERFVYGSTGFSDLQFQAPLNASRTGLSSTSVATSSASTSATSASACSITTSSSSGERRGWFGSLLLRLVFHEQADTRSPSTKRLEQATSAALVLPPPTTPAARAEVAAVLPFTLSFRVDYRRTIEIAIEKRAVAMAYYKALATLFHEQSLFRGDFGAVQRVLVQCGAADRKHMRLLTNK